MASPANKKPIPPGYRCNKLVTTGKELFVKNKVKYECVCDCGTVKLYDAYYLRHGLVKSCGCIRKSEPNRKTHGLSRTKMYARWAHIKRRCLDPNDPAYKDYGGRGITISNEWLDFGRFYADMGDPPNSGMQIDRRDNNRGYCKENCRWVTSEENNRNRRNNIYVEYDGKIWCASALAYEHGIDNTTFVHRLNNGWSLHDAIHGKKPENVKLDITQVKRIRALGDVVSRARLGAMFGITKVQVGKILRNECWKNIG